MPIDLVPPSIPAPWEILKGQLSDFAELAAPVEFPEPTPRNYQAQILYRAGTQSLAENAPLSDEPSGWRFVALNRRKEAVAAYVDDVAGRIVTISYGKALDVAYMAAQALSKRTEPTGQYEVRILEINGLLTEAFWLSSPSAGQGLFIPYATSVQGLEKDTVYAWADFLAKLIPAAKSRVDADKIPHAIINNGIRS